MKNVAFNLLWDVWVIFRRYALMTVGCYRRAAKISWYYIWHGDFTLIRIYLGISSFGCMAELWAPWNTFDRHGYELIRAIYPEWVFALLFTVHFLGVFWRIGDVERVSWGVAVNVLGFVLFGSLAVGLDTALKAFTLPSSLTGAASIFSLLATVRTGNGTEGASA